MARHGGRARHSPSVLPNESFAPPTKSFVQAIRVNEIARKSGGWLTRSASRHGAGGSHICSTRERNLALAVAASVAAPKSTNAESPRRCRASR